ncbi:MAG: chemotaxis protein CheW [Acidiferrobacterales bacterium]|jgi:purine-binding chemotaxis protein CheW|nr:chemotaxis protein CheW [Acidiferrobacterales bacterium]
MANSSVASIEMNAQDTRNQYLTFFLAGEEYGVSILDVQEVRVWDGVTSIPNAPVYIKGVLDLRGVIVPIIDLRIRFNMESVDYDETTVIVVLKIEAEGKVHIIGIVVDAVSDVLDVSSDQQKAAPDFETSGNTEFISGLATVNDKMVILLDTNKLLSRKELSAITETE